MSFREDGGGRKKVTSRGTPRNQTASGCRLKATHADALPDLAMFDLAIDSELRGCDVVRLKGMTVDHAMVRERETGPAVRSEEVEV